MSLPTAPFIKKSATVPPGQVQRFGPTQELQMAHYDTPLNGSGQQLGNDEALFNAANRLGRDDLCSLRETGRFSDWKQFIVYGISFQMFFSQIVDPAVGEASAEELYDLLTYYARLHVRYQDAEKQILWVDQLPSGGGTYGFSTTGGAFHLTNGTPISGGFYKLNEGMVITPQKTFRLTLRWLSEIANVAPAPAPFGGNDPRQRFNAAVNSNKLMRITLHGIEGRDIDNG